MKWETSEMSIPTWNQRCEQHPDHAGVVTEAMIRARMQEEIDELREAMGQTDQGQDWSLLKATQESLREHMTEIDRLRTVGRQALEALEIAMRTPINEYLPREPLDAINSLVAVLEPKTNFCDKGGDKLSPPSDRPADAQKTTANVRSFRTVESDSLGDDEIYDAAFAMYCRGSGTREMFRLMWSCNPAPSIGWDREELKAFARRIASLYTAPPPRQPLTDEQIDALFRAVVQQPHIAQHYKIEFARAIEAAHGIKG